jgi:hypothetical protein
MNQNKIITASEAHVISRDKNLKHKVLKCKASIYFNKLCLSLKLKIFERKILRSICGPVQDSNNEWRVRTNQETEALMKGENIVQFIKSQRLAWYGHVNRMEDNKNVKGIMKWNPTDRSS